MNQNPGGSACFQSGSNGACGDAPGHKSLLSVIIPALDEANTIRGTVDRVLQVPGVTEVIVVDDGSTDDTSNVLRSIVDARLRLLRHPTRQGKGAAIRTALPYVEGEVVVIQDADTEYTPEELPTMAGLIHAGEAQVVYGSRFRGSIIGMRPVNRIANHLLTITANLLFRARITDEATCYKMFRTSLLRDLDLQCANFEFCPEVTAKVLRRGIAIAEVPITYHARPHSAGKKIRWWHFLTAFWTLLKYRFT